MKSTIHSAKSKFFVPSNAIRHSWPDLHHFVCAIAASPITWPALMMLAAGIYFLFCGAGTISIGRWWSRRGATPPSAR